MARRLCLLVTVFPVPISYETLQYIQDLHSLKQLGRTLSPRRLQICHQSEFYRPRRLQNSRKVPNNPKSLFERGLNLRNGHALTVRNEQKSGPEIDPALGKVSVDTFHDVELEQRRAHDLGATQY